jgi:hypothetical protein
MVYKPNAILNVEVITGPSNKALLKYPDYL